MKDPAKSKTMLFALTVGVAAFLNDISATVTDPQTLNWIGMGIALCVAILRLRTNEPINPQ